VPASAAELPAEARETLKLIDVGGAFPYRRDGITFQNREGRLPDQPRGYYREYTVPTPGSPTAARGASSPATSRRSVLLHGRPLQKLPQDPAMSMPPTTKPCLPMPRAPACITCRTVHRRPAGRRRAAGCLVLRVDLAAARDKEAMLDAVAKGLRFPEWFGHNWDALTDCLLDMGWLPAPATWSSSTTATASTAAPKAISSQLMQVFQEAADTWREDGMPFWCLVDMQADGIAWLPTVPSQDDELQERRSRCWW
jgi:RNAse (barnase) inhibitor barstar